MTKFTKMSYQEIINIAIIEDNEDDLYFIKKYLGSDKNVVAEISNGRQALEYLKKPNKQVDIVLLDYNLPEYNGIEILSKLEEKKNDYAFIFLSVDNSIETVIEAMKSGANDFIVKSRNIKNELNQKIDKVYKLFKHKKDKEKYKAYLASLTEAGSDSIWSIDKNYLFTSINKYFKSWFKELYNVDLNIGANAIAVLPSANQSFWKSKYDLVLKGQKIIFEYTENINKKEHFYEVRLNPVEIEEEIIGVLAVNREITQHKVTEQKLIQSNEEYSALNEELKVINHELNEAWGKLEISENKLRQAQEMAQLGYWEYDVEDDQLTWSKVVYQIFEQAENKFSPTLKNFFKLIHPGDRETVEQAYLNSLNNKTAYEIEHRLLLNNGKLKYVKEKCNTNFDQSGKPIKSFGIVQDISAIKKAEIRIKEKNIELLKAKQKSDEIQEQLQLAIEVANLGYFDWKIPKNELKWDANMHSHFGLEITSKKERLKHFYEVIHEEDKQSVVSNIERIFKPESTNTIFNDEFRVYHPSGKIKYIQTQSLGVRNDNHEVVRIIGTCLDVTQQKEAEKELVKHKEHLEEIVKGRTEELKSSFEELKVTNEELFIQKDSLEKTLKTLSQAQAQLVQSEKMAALGTLVAGVAHEINNPVNFINSSLTALKNNVDYLSDYVNFYHNLNKENFEEITKAISEKESTLPDIFNMFRKSIEIIEIGVKRTTKIVKSLKSFAHADEKELAAHNIHDNIDNTLLILYNQYKNRIEIIKDYQKIPEIECFIGQINQVFMNILINAIHAIEEKGTIKINTIPNEKYVSIEIHDSGSGISAEHLKNIFDPFFTTKKVGKGTGLGLSISYNIIKKHHGKINVQSKVGEGSCFTIVLPIRQIPNDNSPLFLS